MAFKTWLRSFWQSHTFWLSLLVPLLASPLPLMFPGPIAKCGYCVIVIGVFWVTEIIPLAMTSLLPVFMFPVFGLMPAKEVCMTYVQDTLMLFLASLIVAVAVEKWNLHKRLALRTLTLVGPQPKWLLLGVMVPTWFLSMWMSNTATTAMMVPIVSAILIQIRECQNLDSLEEPLINDGNDVIIKMDQKGKEVNENIKSSSSREAKEKQFLAFAKTFSLSTAFSANIGGVATLTGTPPNVIFKGLADVLYKKYEVKNPVDFANWLGIGMPLAVILIIFLWLWMQMYSEGLKCLMFWKKDNTSYEKVRVSLQQEYKKMGSMSFAEISVTVLFVILALLWITRSPGFIKGWSVLFLPDYVRDSTPAILISILLFILPAHLPDWMMCCKSKSKVVANALSPPPKYEPLLDWATVNKKMAWGVLLLMGGGFAVAEGCEKSGLSGWVSTHLEGLSSLPTWLTCTILTLLVAITTEFTSNAATTTLFVPIVGDLALKLGVNPLYFMIPCTLSASLAFLLPVATPSNAIVFATGYLKVKDMVIAGLPIQIFSIVILTIACNSWVASLFSLYHIPPEFSSLLVNNSVPHNSSRGVSSLLSVALTNVTVGYNLTH
ncbi:Na(+)/citrate cotransporter-like [Biomphalaria glabrata]|uniref:Na(+)/citrate cotransporter-like n=1 Tax=Biomphalaria glabrata TaxID=6526 RepID=A0A9W2YFK2_BIOGL|nr:Na(+)/citrate cotransporter-like [Biomphalaria glabrata]XP_055861525.1 Na(+)/citrate cotransporter-like [Biomphalaria glabrata]